MFKYRLYLGFLVIFNLHLHAQESPQNPPTKVPSLVDQTLELARGHQQFQDLIFKQHEEDFVRLVEKGQNPQILFIGCSDSRVVPDLILSTRPGDLFVIRTAGNFVPPASFQEADGVMATVQYGIEVLNIPHIIVCGHSHCGAIQGLFQQLDSTKLGILQRWLKFGEEAKQMALKSTNPSTPKQELYSMAEKISVIYQLEHLLTFPFIRKRVQEGTLELHGWYFKIETGELFYYNTQRYRFVPLLGNALDLKSS